MGWVLAFTLVSRWRQRGLRARRPRLQASRVDLNDALKQGSTRQHGRQRGTFARRAGGGGDRDLMVLLVGAGLLIRSFDRLTRVELGFRADHLLVMNTNLPAQTEGRRAAVERGLRRSRAADRGDSGVLSASAAMGLAGGPPRSNGGYSLEGGPGVSSWGCRRRTAISWSSMPDYFKTIGVRAAQRAAISRIATASMAS